MNERHQSRSRSHPSHWYARLTIINLALFCSSTVLFLKKLRLSSNLFVTRPLVAPRTMVEKLHSVLLPLVVHRLYGPSISLALSVWCTMLLRSQRRRSKSDVSCWWVDVEIEGGHMQNDEDSIGVSVRVKGWGQDSSLAKVNFICWKAAENMFINILSGIFSISPCLRAGANVYFFSISGKFRRWEFSGSRIITCLRKIHKTSNTITL